MRERPQPPAWTPPPPSHELEGALFSLLADVSFEDLANGLSDVGSMPIASIGKMFMSAIQRFRRPRGEVPSTPPASPEPPEGCFDMLDPWPLWRLWQAAGKPDYQSDDTPIIYDALGMAAGHLSLDGKTAALFRLAPSGQPHRLIGTLDAQGPIDLTKVDLIDAPLEVRIDGELHHFRHVRAGPVVGEIAVGERVYLLAVVSTLFVLIEGRADVPRVVWGGRLEKLQTLVIETQRYAPEAAPSGGGAPPAATDRVVAELDPLTVRLAAASQRCAELAAELGSERRAREVAEAALVQERSAREEEQCRRLAAQQAAQVAIEAQSKNADLGIAFRAEIELQANERAATDSQAVKMIATLSVAVLLLTKQMMEETDGRVAAEAHAAEAEEMRAALIIENTELQAEAAALAVARDTSQAADVAEILRLRGLVEALTPRANTADGAAKQVADGELAKLAERLLATEAKLAALQRAQADDAAHLTKLVESNRIPEAITFFAGRVLGASTDDIEDVLDTLADQKDRATPESLILATPLPVFAEPARSMPTHIKCGRNDPCPCGSGKKYKRCCWLTAG